MTNEEGVVRSVSWRDLCPWLILFRLYRLSASVQLLLLAFLGAWAISIGWTVCGSLCLSDESRSEPRVQRYLNAVVDWPESTHWRSYLPASTVQSQTATPPAAVTAQQPETPAVAITALQPETPPPALSTPSVVIPAAPIRAADAGPLAVFWHQWLGRTPMYAIMEPVRRWFDPTIPWDQFAFYFLGGLWSLLVWSLLGGAITRAAVVRLGRDERVGLRESLGFAARKLVSIAGAPLLPLAAIFALGIPLFILGLLMRLNIGVALGSLLWLPVGLIGFCMTLFALGLMFGWPLMWSAISAEGSDAFDAISRSYAYTFQRPLQYFVYFLAALVLGLLGWIVVGLIAQSVVQFTLLAVGTGTGDLRLDQLRSALAGTDESGSSLLWFGSTLIGFFNRCILGVPLAFTYSFMWSAAAAIYLLLRQDADQTELDDVYLDEDKSVNYGLPPLTVDQAGVPGTDEAADAALAAGGASEPPGD
jgi:hypothetical protein